MKKPGKGIITFGIALLLCALLFAEASAAHADNNQLQTILVKGPVATFASGGSASSTAVCPQQGQVVTGGSFDNAITAPGNGLVQITQSQSSLTTWTVTGSSPSGGAAGTVTAVAVCSSPQLQTSFASGPVTPFASGQTVSSTAKCPDGLVVTGGSFGDSITAPGVLPFSFTLSQPSPKTWTATAVSGPGGFAGTITAFAVCSSAPPHQQLTTVLTKGPVVTFAIGGTASSTAKCPEQDQVVTGGSFDVSITGAGSSGAVSFTQTQTAPNTWTITAVSGPGGAAGTVSAVAVCSSLS